MNESRHRVVVVGGGFGGLSCARALGNQKGVEVTLIDRRNHHLFQPLLYQVATAGLSPAEIAAPIRSVLSKERNVRVILAEVTGIDLSRGSVQTAEADYAYDTLVLACGASHSYFGHEEWEAFAPGLKTLEQATEIRRRALLAFEEAEKSADPERQKAFLTFAVVGGGPTGVELAGALAEISRKTLGKDFRMIDPSRTRVLLIEAGARVLAAFDESLSKRATRDLERMGVQVWTQTRVTKVTDDGVELGSEKVRAKTVIWAAGVKPSRLNELLPGERDSAGRVRVEPDLSLKGHPEVFVLGDQAHALDAKTGQPLPGLAPVALQQGRATARNILRSLRQQPREAFRYLDKGQMATIGRKKAVLQVGRVRLGGYLAWLSWLFVHIYFLIGFKNRLMVFIQWAWSYFTFKRGARLIVDREWHRRS